jgi:hypothetical protein
MRARSLRTPLFAAAAVLLPSLAAAQFPPPPAPVQERWPTPPAQQPPRAQTTPAPEQPAPLPQPEAAEAPAPKRTKKAAAPASVVACGGVFAKDPTQVKIATKYDSKNVVFGEVNGPDNSKIHATILFPDDAKRRLEVLWANEAARSDIQLISINGKSQWRAPKGLKLGFTMAALQKLNGRPFKLTGFGADGMAAVLDWQGGGLESLPGGCKLGVRLAPGADVPEEARQGAAGDKDMFSNDAALRGAKPTVAEILIGY